MTQQKGFTLIELIIVIVILGILAVTAAPKFIDMQGDARSATLKGMDAALKSAAAMAYSKSIIAGTEKNATASLSVNNETINLAFGYPTATANGIGGLIDAPDTDWTGTAVDASHYILTPAGMTSGAAGTCKVTYTQASSITSGATTTVDDSGC